MVNHTDIQYEEGNICERTDPPYDQGCLGRGSAEFKQQWFIHYLNIYNGTSNPESTYNGV